MPYFFIEPKQKLSELEPDEITQKNIREQEEWDNFLNENDDDDYDGEEWLGI